MKRPQQEPSTPMSPAICCTGLHPELRDEERQPCEVWTRVMGYHRPVSSFNTGKKGEHYERKFFLECKIPH